MQIPHSIVPVLLPSTMRPSRGELLPFLRRSKPVEFRSVATSRPAGTCHILTEVKIVLAAGQVRFAIGLPDVVAA